MTTETMTGHSLSKAGLNIITATCMLQILYTIILAVVISVVGVIFPYSFNVIQTQNLPKNEDQEQAFSKMCAYLEANDEEQLTVSDLQSKMKEYLCEVDSLPFGNQYLKAQLKERFGDEIFFAEGKGLDDIVTMREKTSHILRSYFKNAKKESDEESQKRAILETAARLIKSDIKTNIPSINDQYPTTEAIKLQSALEYIPESLSILLKTVCWR